MDTKDQYIDDTTTNEVLVRDNNIPSTYATPVITSVNQN